MSVQGAWPFDEWDAGSDSQYVGGENTSMTPSTDVPYGSGKSLAMNGSVTPSSNRVILPFKTNCAGKNTYIGIWVWIPLTVDTLSSLFSLQSVRGDTNGRQLTIRITTNRGLAAYRGNTLLATGVTEGLSGWNFIQLDALIHNTTGEVELFLNGSLSSDLSFTGDTQEQSTDAVLALRLGHDGSTAGYGNSTLNDALKYFLPVVFDSDGTKDNGHVPSNIKYGLLHTIADTADIFTPSTGGTVYNLIDELLGAPSDADYGSSNTLNERNVCQLTALPGDVSRVVALIHNSRVGKPEAGTIGVKFGITDGTSETQSAERLLPASFTNYVDVFEYLTGTTEYNISNTLYVSTEVTTAG